jgi:hypothetical protein
MPPEGLDVQGHSNHREEVAGRADGQDARCGTFQAEACGREECLEERIGTRVEVNPGL